MTKIILKKDKISKNEYFVVDDPTFVTKSTSEHLIVTTSQWSDNKNTLLRKKKNIGIKLHSDESVVMIEEDINFFKIIQFHFLTFKDGRPFSEAKRLRNEFKYTGEIRASGHIIPDQYIFLLRCGFNSVEIDSKNKKFWLECFKMDTGLYYQP